MVPLPCCAVLAFLLCCSAVSSFQEESDIHIAIVACNDPRRAEEALTLIRSIVINSADPQSLVLHLVHEKSDGNNNILERVLNHWKNIRYYINEAALPESYARLFAPCACQRLFLHEVLPDSVSRVVYLDSDTILLDDVANLWQEFESVKQQDPTILAALAAEHESTAKNAYYRDEAKHPYYNLNGTNGLNSGVMILDLDLLRKESWNQQLDDFRNEYDLVFFDQDLLNVYFHKHAERLHLLESCRWNYRSDHCYYRNHCPDQTDLEGGDDGKRGISILHGSRGVFHKGPEEEFSVIAFSMFYSAFRVSVDGNIETGNCVSVYLGLEETVTKWMSSVTASDMTNNCQAIALPAFLHSFMKHCNSLQTRRSRKADESEL